ncbi:SDR family NAD(P)-dependent oxidoreductase [Hyunsoonleella pacifica]|nr:SDR family NAD(P)-dependent oxidoreductase [Hyunsoonleella pacifica]
MKTAIITGGTSGIGLSIVKHLSNNNWNVYFIGTNANKGVTIEQKLSKTSKGSIKFYLLDLSNLNKVRKFADTFLKRHQSLELLANIAGVLLPKREVSENGTEKNFTISYLSAYILSNMLSPLLKEGKNSRIVNVSAAPKIALQSELDFDNLNGNKNYNSFKASGNAIHAKTVLTQILSEKFMEDNIDVNAFDPGVVNSKLTRKMPIILRSLMNLFFLFASKESKIGIHVCTSENINGITGKLFSRKEFIPLIFDSTYKADLLNHTKKYLY